MRVDAERQFAQAAQEQSKLEEKLAQVERNALLTLNNKEQIHREQLEAERRQKVQQDWQNADLTRFKSDALTNLLTNQVCVCVWWLTGAAVCGADGSA